MRRAKLIWFGSALAAAALLVAAVALRQPGGARGLLIRWFGPPQVELSETHAPEGGIASFDHGLLDGLLQEFVDVDGYVDYAGLASRREQLRSYLRALETAPFEELGRDEKLALLLNAYNAFTLELILDHLPLDSIRDIPSAQRWKAVRWKIAGRFYSLDQIEHEEIRPKFREPRIHFAVVCAAIGCPPLRREAYTGIRLNEQLEDQARRVHHDERWLQYEPGSTTIRVTRLYEWYRDDFEQVAGSIIEYVARYREDVAGGETPTIRFLDYDWALNDRQNRPARARGGEHGRPSAET